VIRYLARAVAIVLVASAVMTCSARPATDASATPSSAASATPIALATATATATPTPTPTLAPWDAPLKVANDATALAAQLVVAEALIRDPKATTVQLAWAGHLEQLSIARLADFPDWTEPVLAALPAEPRAAIAGSIEAGKQLRAMHAGPIPKNLPDWHIVQPPPIEELMTYYREAEQKFGVPWYFLASIHLVETRMGRIRGDSSAGAQGPMQFIPSTWAAYGEGDVDSPHDAILAAGRYLKAAGAPGNMPKAVFAYNHDTRYVAAVTAYAEVMHKDAAAYRGYYGWQVYYPTKDGPIHMPVGWKKE
jgi:membrane-bound lytic murein transglycosylase B